MKNTKGFSLLELIIVIAIILILASIAIPAYMRASANNDDVKVKEDKKFSQNNLYSQKFSQNNLYSQDKNNPEGKNNPPEAILFHTKIVGKTGNDNKVFEFCYDGVKYFGIVSGYMAPKMIKASNGVIHYETCD